EPGGETPGPLRYAGRVGSGFTSGELDRMGVRLAALASDECPFDPPPPPLHCKGAHWVRPEVVVEVEYGEWTNEGRLRHSVYLDDREDKAAAYDRHPQRTDPT